jgi:TolB-like protein
MRVYAINPAALWPLSSPAMPVPRLSIVVLPFANLGRDPEQDYLADGITEDLTTDLSRIPGMVVISRNTAFTYRTKTADSKQIGRELNVRYLLEGSVRRLGNQVRVNASLSTPKRMHTFGRSVSTKPLTIYSRYRTRSPT